jgi:phospholipid/cholesterol/gamma-HCH transport system substrate-binding protein
MVLGNSTEYAADGFTLNTNVERGIMESVQPVQKKAEQIIAKMDSVLTSVNTILNPNFQQNVEKSFTSISATLASLESTSKKVDLLVGSESSKLSNILSNVESISVNFKNNGAKIDAVLNNLTTTTDKMAALNFKQTVDNANKAMSDLQLMIADIKAGKGSIGKLINDEQMYQNLNNASKNLDALMIDLKANPKRYVHFSVFGKNNKVDK